MEDLKYWVGLSQFPKFGPARFKKLKKHFADMASAFKATVSELRQSGIEEKIAEEFATARIAIEPDKLMEKLVLEKIQVATIEDKYYPKLLKEIYDPPFILYYRGDLKNQNEFSLAVVGSRKFSNYGKQVTEKIVRDLAQNNLTIVSGLALGIDTLAHEAALSGGGKTIAVLASGLDKQNIYPSQNRFLADKIINQGGAVISEFPLGTLALKHHFPQRNRLISGLSLATLVIEAGEKSGSLITAAHALDQNRDVFAVPGNIFSPYSLGTNQLIKQGAKAITTAFDIIESLNLAQVASFIESKSIIPETAEEEIVLVVLNHEPMHVDELARLTKLNTSVINSTLTIMEMKGKVKNLGGMQYVLAR